MPTFYDRFVECAERWPDHVALEIQHEDRNRDRKNDDADSLTYAELRERAESVARWIGEGGFARGSRLAIVADNDPRWVVTFLGIVAAGSAAVPLDTTLHADQLTKLLNDSGSALLFCDARHADICRQAVAGSKTVGGSKIVKSTIAGKTIAGKMIGVVLMDPERLPTPAAQPNWLTTLPAIFDAGPEAFERQPAAGDELAALLYTSGTTADPKGVMLTHANLLAEVEAVFNWVDISPSDALLGVLPMFHVLALMANLMLPLVKGARVCYLETLNTTQLLRALQERSITVFAVVPQFFNLIHQRIFEEVAKRGSIAQKLLRMLMNVNCGLRKVRLDAGRFFFRKVHNIFGRRMRYLVTGGSRFDPFIASDFYAMGIDVLQAYGLTETTAAVFANSPGNNVIGSVGKAMKGVEGKIVEAQINEAKIIDTKTADPQAQEDSPATGEVALRGGVVMKGYWNRPDATAAVLREGWFYTGDLGHFDSNGNLFLTGRKKDIIVLSNGKNIYPEEVEAHYLKSPYIKELAVVGIEGKGGEGDRIHAVIVPNFDVLRQKKIVNAKEVIRFDIESLSQQMASTKRIGSYEIWQDDLPRTTTRKIKRFEVEKRVKENTSRKVDDGSELSQERPLTSDEEAWLERADVQRAMKVVREVAPKSPSSPSLLPTHSLELDLGLDSMQRIELLSHIEQQLGGNVSEAQLAEIYTVRDLVDAVLGSAASGAGAPGKAPGFAGWKAVFAEEPDPTDVTPLTRPQAISGTFWYVVSRLIQVIALDRFHLRVTGIEKLPKSGGYILSSNHQSYLDPLMLASVLPPPVFKKVFAVGTSEIFGQGFMRRLARTLRLIVVDPDANLVPAMRASAFGLRQGRPLILYPEGERSIDGTPKILKKGAAILSIQVQVPIVPIAIEGFYKAWPRNQSFRGFAPLEIRIGDPIYPPPEIAASEEAYAKLTAELRAKVVEMWEALRKTHPNRK
ncbi:MAG: AMP-binding protein [Candidatus Sulfotelmatobacter sp.]